MLYHRMNKTQFFGMKMNEKQLSFCAALECCVYVVCMFWHRQKGWHSVKVGLQNLSAHMSYWFLKQLLTNN